MTWNKVLWILVLVTFIHSAWDIGVLEKRVAYLERALELEQKHRLDTEVPTSAGIVDSVGKE